jgi:iron-sulfur cluster assembly accessory protein
MFELTTKEIAVTPSALAYLTKIGLGAAGLRLSILGGKGCGGNEYDLRPVQEEEISPDDASLCFAEGLRVFIPQKDVLKLFGTKIDYIEDEIGNRRLDISNPNETGRCGCGKSVNF